MKILKFDCVFLSIVNNFDFFSILLGFKKTGYEQ